MEESILIEKYLRNELTLEERSGFEDRLASDVNLQESLALHKQAMEAVRQHAREQMKLQLKDRWSPEQFSARPTNQWLLWLIAGAFAFSALGIWLWNKSAITNTGNQEAPGNPIDSNRIKSTPMHLDTLPATPDPKSIKKKQNEKNPDKEKLYAAYFKPYSSNDLGIQVRSLEEETAFARFLNAYLNRDFKQALSDFPNLTQEDQANENIQFLKANALLATNQTRSATTILEKICAEKTSNYLVDAQWYLGLAYLRIGKIDEARATFQFIRSADADKHPYAPQANKLLIEGF